MFRTVCYQTHTATFGKRCTTKDKRIKNGSNRYKIDIIWTFLEYIRNIVCVSPDVVGPRETWANKIKK